MTIDELGKSAAAEARSRAARHVDPGPLLARLERTRRARDRSTIAVALAVVAVIALLTTGDLLFNDHPKRPVDPASPSTPTDSLCRDPRITCPTDGRFRVRLPAPLTLSLPPNFERDIRLIGRNTVETYRRTNTAGVTVMERARPVRNDGSWSRDPAAGRTAHSMALWLTHRPFLTHVVLHKTSVGRLTAWRVTASLRTSAHLRALGGVGKIAPTFAGDAGREGYAPTLTGEYLLLDTPAGAVTTIWSWTRSPDSNDLDTNHTYIQTLNFE
jgi:hypothetical protein